MTRRADKTTKAEKPKPKPRAPAKPPNKLPASKSAAALLAAIWANPKDADALRVYADWLIEQGSTRGEFIQLWLAENYEPANKLRKKYRGDWLGEARPFVRSWTDSNDVPGFVSRVTCEADKLLAGFDAIAGLGPRMQVQVTAIAKRRRQTEAALAKLAFRKLGFLDLYGNSLDDTSLIALAPAFDGLPELSLSGNYEITAAGVTAIGRAVDTLRGLSLPCSDDLATAVLETPGFRSLAHLHFNGPIAPELVKQLEARGAQVECSEYQYSSKLFD